MEVFCVDVRGGHVPGLDKGLLDFAVLRGLPNERKYEHLLFPEADYFGLVMRKDDCLAGREGIRVGDLVGLPLFCSKQSWEGDIRPWAKERFGELRLEGSFRLAYNGSVFVKEGLGYLLALDGLVDTSSESGLVFRPLSPALEVPLCLAWGRRQTLTPIAKRFLDQLRAVFAACGREDHFAP